MTHLALHIFWANQMDSFLSLSNSKSKFLTMTWLNPIGYFRKTGVMPLIFSSLTFNINISMHNRTFINGLLTCRKAFKSTMYYKKWCVVCYPCVAGSSWIPWAKGKTLWDGECLWYSYLTSMLSFPELQKWVQPFMIKYWYLVFKACCKFSINLSESKLLLKMKAPGWVFYDFISPCF